MVWSVSPIFRNTLMFLLPLSIPAAMLLVIFQFITWIPPESITSGRMTSVSRDILEFALSIGVLPDDLGQVRDSPNSDPSNYKDSWGRPLIYHRVSDDRFKLTSYGADGVPGGPDRSSDIVQEFSIDFDAGELRPVLSPAS